MNGYSLSALKRKLAVLTGKGGEKHDDGVDELNALLLQIVLAVMLIFMIAFFLFINKVGGEISRIDQMRQKISEAEQAEWLHALEQVTERYRIAYGLLEFLHVDPVTGEKSYDFSGMIAEGKLVGSLPRRRAFCLGAAAAYRDYSAVETLEKAWLQTLAEMRGKPAEGTWLRTAVQERIHSLRREVAEVQTLAAAEIQRTFAARPELLSDDGIARLLKQIDREKDPSARAMLLEKLNRDLRRCAYGYLEKASGVPVLEVQL